MYVPSPSEPPAVGAFRMEPPDGDLFREPVEGGIGKYYSSAIEQVELLLRAPSVPKDRVRWVPALNRPRESRNRRDCDLRFARVQCRIRHTEPVRRAD